MAVTESGPFSPSFSCFSLYGRVGCAQEGSQVPIVIIINQHVVSTPLNEEPCGCLGYKNVEVYAQAFLI